jgi:hypothetical protein
MGVISFCAYNTGIGWRQIVEKKQVTPDERQHHEEMARLYRQHVLKGDPSMISVGMLKAAARKQRLAPSPYFLFAGAFFTGAFFAGGGTG